MPNLVDVGAVVITTADGAAAMQMNPSAVNVISTGGQIAAAFVSVSPVGTIAIAPGAAVMTGIKIVVDLQGGQTASGGDILSIAGNVVGIIGAVGAFTVGGPVVVTGAALGLGLAAAGAILNSMDSGAWPSLLEAARRKLVPGYAAEQAMVDWVVNERWRTATAPTRRDPLAIDLDGDGIETVGIPTTGSPILFDHDADGIKTGTGWVKPDDAWLVLDRDENGSIDSGRELFGVDTFITVTEPVAGNPEPITYTRPARTGFEALRSLDTGNGTPGSAGHGDGLFDARDAAFTKVRLWQDQNQDGVSQAGELFSLAGKKHRLHRAGCQCHLYQTRVWGSGRPQMGIWRPRQCWAT